MTTTLAQALAALEKVAERTEALEGRIAAARTRDQRLRSEVEAAIRDLDRLIGDAR